MNKSDTTPATTTIVATTPTAEPQLGLHASVLGPDDQIIESVGYDFGWSRRGFVQALGAGLLIAVAAPAVLAQGQPPPAPAPQERRGQGRVGGSRPDPRPTPLGARLHLAPDGAITVLTGKVEGGQGSRAELTQAAAEELRVAPEQVKLIMADSALVPDDGMTVGSRTTPSTVPVVRQGCAAARQLLANTAAGAWGIESGQVTVSDGAARDSDGKRSFSYADLAKSAAAAEAFKADVPKDVQLTPIARWKTMGTSVPRPNGRDLVTGGHKFPSDIVRPGMLYAKVLRPPSYGATLSSVDLGPVRAMKGVAAVRDGNYVAVAAPTTHAAKQAIAAIEPSAKWERKPHPSSRELFAHLREHARDGVPANPYANELNELGKHHHATYQVAYVQHAPLEPRAAVAEWEGDKLTVWTATQRPTGVRRELAEAFRIPEDRVRLIVPDFGGGFGGKHTGECAVECARIAKAAGKPVALRWTRAEEFTWAVFRPAALIDIEATVDEAGKLTSWHYVNINSGRAGIDTPYKSGRDNIQFVETDAPLRHGSYRALAATANAFARESFIDELARATQRDPLEYRLAHLRDDRIRAVLEAAAKGFDWSKRGAEKSDGTVGVGIACGQEKGSVVAACVEVEVERANNTIRVRRVCQAFECGKIINPDNLRAQVDGGIVQALGPALREASAFEGGKITNATFWEYAVPRLADVPALDIHLLDRPDLPSVGAGETPLIALAPAIANAVFHATGVRVRQMPITLPTEPLSGASAR